jgi:hypothetical protein
LSTLASRLGALRQLRSARELALFAYVTAFAAGVPLLMRLPLPRVAALITRRARPVRRTPLRRTPATAERLAELVGLAPRVAHPLVRTGCLTRGVTLFWFLRASGLDVELRFGLDPSDDPTAAGVDGHCWLTLDGRPFLEQTDPQPRFVEVYRLPMAGA